jgi:CubicO group peptidase (beta-lactamase class C family)
MRILGLQDVLGRCLELLSGEPLDKFLQAHVFRPLKMVDTGFFVRLAVSMVELMYGRVDLIRFTSSSNVAPAVGAA